jgi:hypothetical protein
MAVTPNTTFSAGAIFTAAQANRFPRGIMATPATSTTTDSTITAEEVQLTYVFNAVNGRIYQLTYSEPSISSTVNSTITARLRESSLIGTNINSTQLYSVSGFNGQVVMQSIYTATASGSLTIVATLQSSAGTATATRLSSRFPELYAIDMGAS